MTRQPTLDSYEPDGDCPPLGRAAVALTRRNACSLACEQIFEEAVASATAGIWRFTDDSWSVILKVLRHQAGGSPRWQSGEDEDHWYYWRREALAYSSGLLAHLARPLRAPRCYGVFDRPDGSISLWLEDLRFAAPAAAWPLNRYRLAAFAL